MHPSKGGEAGGEQGCDISVSEQYTLRKIFFFFEVNEYTRLYITTQRLTIERDSYSRINLGIDIVKV